MTPTVDTTLAALADPVRRAIIDRLRVRPHRSSELAELLALPRPVVSKHLAVLRKAGVVDDHVLAEDARGRRIELRAQPFTALRAWLTEVETFWTDELAAFKRHAERPRTKR
jgi:DNA-binding transcriptional ArsR family regulator